ncbi:tetratricopeptide repeat-containing sulfotransferase family protein [Devosia sp.]|uniref:tetratricopeptide repeat-containing sulfotransferase family protein n=1 Tax=Devosia sp. TaxID=1871048 RepID=UPI003A954C6D
MSNARQTMSPQQMIALLKQGLALQQAGRADEAAGVYAKILAADSNQPDANHLLGLVRLGQEKPAEAVKHLRLAVRGAPRNAQYASNLAAALNADDKPRDAVTVIDRALSIDAGFAGAHANRGMALRALGASREAAKSYRQAITIDPSVPSFHFNLGNAEREAGDYPAAEAAYRAALRRQPTHIGALTGLARVLVLMQHWTEAVAALEDSPEQLHAAPEWQLMMGRAQARLGDLDSAISHYRTAIAARPKCGEALHALALARRHEPADPDIARLKSVFSDVKVASAERTFAGFGLGKALSDAGEHQESIEVFESTNAMQHASHTAPEQPLVVLHALANQFRVLPSEWQPSANSASPIFLVGLPRSGKTTLEHMLSRCDGLTSAGELRVMGRLLADHLPFAGRPASLPSSELLAHVGRDYLLRAAQSARSAGTTIDTMPSNFRLLPFIAFALPKALIVHCVRDPIDHLIAVFQKYLTGAGNEYSSDLRALVTYYHAYRSMMDQWRHLLPGRILEVDVASLYDVGRARDLFEQLGLDPAFATSSEESEPQAGNWSRSEVRINAAAQREAWIARHPDLLKNLARNPSN